MRLQENGCIFDCFIAYLSSLFTGCSADTKQVLRQILERVRRLRRHSYRTADDIYWGLNLTALEGDGRRTETGRGDLKEYAMRLRRIS
jgi:hypothetical protein